MDGFVFLVKLCLFLDVWNVIDLLIDLLMNGCSVFTRLYKQPVLVCLCYAIVGILLLVEMGNRIIVC